MRCHILTSKLRFVELLPYILFSLVYYTTPQPSKSRKECDTHGYFQRTMEVQR
nr:MAG TPA: hypothetical protein [Caudoviricetes sp.]